MPLKITAIVLALAAGLMPVFVPWLKTPVILALSNGLAVLGVIMLIRAGQVSFGHAMFVCASGYAVRSPHAGCSSTGCCWCCSAPRAQP